MRQTTRVLSLLVGAQLGAVACGDDDRPAGAPVALGNLDAGDDGMPDAFVGKPFEPPPERDPIEPEPKPKTDRVAHDAGVVKKVDDEDAGGCDPDVCAAMGDECMIGACDEQSGDCELSAAADGIACGDARDTACTDPDSCQAGECQPNDSSDGSPCGHTDVECQVDDACDGDGHCIDNGTDEGAPCGDSNGTDCDLPDVCDQDGLCQANHAPSGTACNVDTKFAICGPEDTCTGTGLCIFQGIYRPTSRPTDSCPKGDATGAPGHDRCYCDDEDRGFCRPERTLCGDDGTSCYFPVGYEPLPTGTPCGSGMVCDQYGTCQNE